MRRTGLRTVISAKRTPEHRVEVIRYIAVGGLNTGAGLFVIMFLHLGLSLHLLYANAAGYGVGLAISYWGNRNWTFAASAGGKWRSIAAFIAVVGTSFALNILVINWLLAIGITYLGAQISGALVYSILVFWGLKYYAFRS